MGSSLVVLVFCHACKRVPAVISSGAGISVVPLCHLLGQIGSE